MAKGCFSRGFLGRRRETAESSRLPPGQYLTDGFPVLSAGPTPYTPKEKWDFTVVGAVETPQRWTWDQFQQLPRETVTVDIHCVTGWSKFDTKWSGFSLDMILGAAKPQAQYLLVFCDGGYVTNLPLADVTGNKAWIVDTYDGAPLPLDHGGPVRLLVPHLYFWKSAKWGAACASLRTISPASGNRSATTTMVIHGKSSATKATRMAARSCGRYRRRNTAHQEPRARCARLGGP